MPSSTSLTSPNKLALGPVAIIGAGPAGLMAAQTLSAAGVAVQVFDAMPTAARKFLLAGKGGLNLTHAEDFAPFVQRYSAAAPWLAPLLTRFGGPQVRAWAQDLGIDTFVGSSGRVFPAQMKAAPLLRAWLLRLRQPNHSSAVPVQFFMRQRWLGWAEDGQALQFATAAGEKQIPFTATILALGGASWPHLGSDAAWLPLLQARGVDVAPLQAANCGFDVAGREGASWTPHFADKFAGQPFKTIAISWTDAAGKVHSRKGECVATSTGIEGSVIYTASADLREAINAQGQALLTMNLLPDWQQEKIAQILQAPRAGKSLSAVLKSKLKLDGIKTALMYELLSAEQLNDPLQLASALQAVPITLLRVRPIAEAISSAGGVRLEALNEDLMLKRLPGVFCAGEMLDWEAPTGGYLLTACMATGVQAAEGVLRYLAKQPLKQS